MLDVDWFKQFNDHSATPPATSHSRTSPVRCNSVRRSDLVARYGGEEFVVLLRETDPA